MIEQHTNSRRNLKPTRAPCLKFPTSTTHIIRVMRRRLFWIGLTFSLYIRLLRLLLIKIVFFVSLTIVYVFACVLSYRRTSTIISRSLHDRSPNKINIQFDFQRFLLAFQFSKYRTPVAFAFYFYTRSVHTRVLLSVNFEFQRTLARTQYYKNEVYMQTTNSHQTAADREPMEHNALPSAVLRLQTSK